MAGITGEYLDYAEGEAVCEAYLAYDPAVTGARPCVLIAHAWDGQNDVIRGTAEKLAALGYLAFAVDVYGKGVRGGPHEDNSKLMAPFVADRGLLKRRMLAAVAAAQAHPLARAGGVAAIGYCFGGMCVLDLARSGADGVLGVASFHGVYYPPGLGPQEKITAKVLVMHGWDDPMAPPDQTVGLARELTDAGADWQLHAYGHAMHAFTFPGASNPQGGILYDAAADRRSWKAMLGFLEEVFG